MADKAKIKHKLDVQLARYRSERAKRDAAMTQTERDLIEISRRLGIVKEWSAWATAELAERIEKKCKGRIADLTIAQLLRIIDNYDAELRRKNETMKLVTAMRRDDGSGNFVNN